MRPSPAPITGGTHVQAHIVKPPSNSRPLLGLRLGAIACALSVPVVALTLNENAKIDREMRQLQREKIAVHWIALADYFVNDVEMAESGSGRSLRARARARIDGRLLHLERYSKNIARAVPSAPQAFSQIDRAWRVDAAAPSGASLARLATETGFALDSVSDSSQLSFESHQFIADLGDALDNSYYRVFSPLGAAAEITQGGSLSFGKRIQVGGEIALSRLFNTRSSTILNPPSTLLRVRPVLFAPIGTPRSTLRASSDVTSRRLSKSPTAVLRRACYAASACASPHDLPRL